MIDTLANYRASRFKSQSPLYALVFRIGELESYITCLDTLQAAFESLDSKSLEKQPLSAGLGELYNRIRDTCRNKDFLHLKENLPRLSAAIRDTRSITVGINLDDNLMPASAALLAVNKHTFDGRTTGIFNLLFSNRTTELNGLASLHTRKDPGMSALFGDLEEVTKRICEPVQKALNRYIRINTFLFTDIRDALLFYVCGVSMIRKIRAGGMPVCKPNLAPGGERLTILKDHFNLNLFIRMQKNNRSVAENLVTSDVNLGPEGRIAILTGPNRGGKTVYTQGVGISQVLLQAGLCIPGSRARLSPVDNLFTHFQTGEQTTGECGRFGDEAKRLHEIMQKTTARTLILMNESFTSTNHNESLYIAVDIMKAFRVIGVRAVFATHLLELAEQVEEVNSSVTGSSRLISLVSTMQGKDEDNLQRTYRIMPGPPLGRSYAREIALQYGICFGQLMQLAGQEMVCSA